MSHTGPATGEARGGEKADIARHQKNTNTGLSALSQLSQHEIQLPFPDSPLTLCALHMQRGSCYPSSSELATEIPLAAVCCLSCVSIHFYNNNNKTTKQQSKNKQKNCILHTPTLLYNHCIYVSLMQQYRSPFLTEITNFCHKQENTRTMADIYPPRHKGYMWMTKILGANTSHSAII